MQGVKWKPESYSFLPINLNGMKFFIFQMADLWTSVTFFLGTPYIQSQIRYIIMITWMFNVNRCHSLFKVGNKVYLIENHDVVLMLCLEYSNCTDLNLSLFIFFIFVQVFWENYFQLLIVPQNITIRLSASIAFKIVNQSEYALGL